MRVGLMLAPHGDPGVQVSAAREAEQQGFDFIACGEHVFFHGPTSNAFVTLAAAAGATTRVRLLSALTVLPVYPAALAAKMVATLDGVSGGRFDFGVGVGGEYPPEFDACGVPVSERGARTDEALELLRELLAGKPVHHAGRFATLDGLALDPPPVQRPGPPVWIGGRSRAAMRRAGRHAEVWMPYMYTPQRLAASLEVVRDTAAALGRDRRVRGAIFSWAAVDADAPWARRVACETLNSIYDQDFEPIVDRYVPTGTPQQVIERFCEYAAAGAESIVFSPAATGTDRDRMVRTFAAEVLPALRTFAAPAEGK